METKNKRVYMEDYSDDYSNIATVKIDISDLHPGISFSPITTDVVAGKCGGDLSEYTAITKFKCCDILEGTLLPPNIKTLFIGDFTGDLSYLPATKISVYNFDGIVLPKTIETLIIRNRYISGDLSIYPNLK